MRWAEPNYAQDGRVTLLDVETIAPAAVKVLGLWQSPERTFVITELGTNYIEAGWPKPAGLRNLGIQLSGPAVTASIFGPSPTQPSLDAVHHQADD
jgi:hypothetical protein